MHKKNTVGILVLLSLLFITVALPKNYYINSVNAAGSNNPQLFITKNIQNEHRQSFSGCRAKKTSNLNKFDIRRNYMNASDFGKTMDFPLMPSFFGEDNKSIKCSAGRPKSGEWQLVAYNMTVDGIPTPKGGGVETVNIITICGDGKIIVPLKGAGTVVFTRDLSEGRPPGTFIAKEGDGLPSSFKGVQWVLSMIDLLDNKAKPIWMPKSSSLPSQVGEKKLIEPLEYMSKTREDGVMNSWIEDTQGKGHAQWHYWKYLNPIKSERRPECECDTLDAYLLEKIEESEEQIAWFGNEEYWKRPDKLPADIKWQRYTYELLIAALRKPNTTYAEAVQEVIDISNYRTKQKTVENKDESLEISSMGSESGAETDPINCKIAKFPIPDPEECFPDLWSDWNLFHEEFHVSVCNEMEEAKQKNIAERSSGNAVPELFNYYLTMDTPEKNGEDEVKAYLADIEFLRTWKQRNCK